METIVITGVLKADVDSLHSGPAKEYKAALERTLSGYNGKLEDFKVVKGVITAVIDTSEACDKLLNDLKSEGMTAEKKRPLAAFKDWYDLKQSKGEK